MHHRQSALGVWLSLILGGIFAVTAVVLTLFGADAYASILESGEQNDTTRTATLYIANKVRRHNGIGAVWLDSVEDVPALMLKTTAEDAAILTCLYLYKGHLCEVSVMEGTPVVKAAGQPVLPLHSLSFSVPTPGLITVSMTDGKGHEAAITLYVTTAEVHP